MALKIIREPSRFWAFAHRAKLARARMPFWRVVVEARLDRRARRWPSGVAGAVTAVFVWARTIEEAEGLAALALQDEALATLTADAARIPPAAKPSAHAVAVARTEISYLYRRGEDADAARRGAKA